MQNKIDLEKFNPCPEGLKFYNKYESTLDAWHACERGDWMLWFAAHIGLNRRLIVRTAVKCVLLIKHLIKDERSKQALTVTMRWSYYKASDNEVKNTYDDAAYAAASAAYAASDAASDAAYAYASASDAARKRIKKQQADICRELLTDELEKILNAQQRKVIKV